MNINTSESHINLEEPIAIIGIAGRFPGADTINDFWQNLCAGKDVISRFTDRELLQNGIDKKLIEDSRYIKARGILNNIEKFDADFFNINPYEAAITDPQHRLFLEICWEGLEIAGYIPGKFAGLTGVFAGMSDSTYLLNNLLKNDDFLKNAQAYQTQIATSGHFLATKVAYHLDLRGPCININTGCSTSLLTVIKACQSLQMGECDLAIAGGVSVRVPQVMGYLYREGNIFSADGKCRPFDKNASGTVSSSAAGIVILKRLSNAIEDGDNIEAVIKSFAINNDGSSKAGYTAPSVLEQSRCIATALSYLDDVETISYIETHGTGTVLGDPIEIAALTRAFRHYTKKKNFCAIGSVKSNIGHADTAAGIVGLIKTVLALKHKLIPASLHFEQQNAHIEFADSPFFVNQELREWNTEFQIRRAGVSSFGIGGTNTHVILEEAPKQKLSTTSRPVQILSLSAKSSKALVKQQENVLDFLKQQDTPEYNLADIAYTLHLGRKDFAYRKSYVVCNTQQSIAMLESDLSLTKDESESNSTKEAKITFLFGSLETVFSGMAKAIYETEAVFRKYINLAAAYLEPAIRENVIGYITDSQALNHYSAYIQLPALFIVQYGLTEMLMEWGIKPKALLGYSLGEYAAAYFAGVMSLKDAVYMVSICGKFIDMLPPGSMLFVPQKADKLKKHIEDFEVSLAAISSSASCILSGRHDAIASLEKELNFELDKQGLKCTFLNPSYAIHSALVDDILPQFREALIKVNLQPLKIPYLSNVSGNWMDSGDLCDTNYFAEHLRKTVLFSNNMDLLTKEGRHLLIEVGVGRHIASAATQCDYSKTTIFMNTLHGSAEYLTDKSKQLQSLQNVIALCWRNNIPINWKAYYSNENRQRVSMPTYPFERLPYWVQPSNKTYDEHKPLPYNPTFYSYWEVVGHPAPVEIKQRENWLVFSDNLGVAESLSQYLHENEQNIILVTRGDCYKKRDVASYQINPEEKADYKTLHTTLAEEDFVPDHILHCWSLSKKEAIDTAVSLKDNQINGFYSLIYIAQEFLSFSSEKSLEITLITNYLKGVLDDDYIIPDKATMMGACLVIPQEYSNVSCRIFDTDILELDEISRVKHLPYLIHGSAAYSKDNFIAYRRGIRFVNRFRTEEYCHSEVKEQSLLKMSGTYLITGGLGKIGMDLAEFLAEKYSANLILVSRKHPFEGTVKDSISFANKSVDQERVILIQLENIKKLAASVLLLRADVSDYTQMENIFSIIFEKYRVLDGIFHLAGIADETSKILIKDLSFEQAERMFLPKITGTKVIEKLVNKYPVNFCFLYSSLASVVGGISLSSYAASNSYLDSIADYHRYNTKTHWISINWDAWDFSRNDSKSNEFPKDVYQRINSKEAMRLMESYASKFMDNHNFIVSMSNLNERRHQCINLKDNPDRMVQKVSKLENCFKEGDAVEQNLKGLFKDCLGIDNISNDDNFYDIGGDSLSAIRLIEMLEKNFSARINLSDLINNSSINQLAKFIQHKTFSQKNSFVIKLNKLSDNNSPLFMIHPVGGSIFCYRDLAYSLAESHPFYALQDPNLDFNQVDFNSMEEIASYYLQYIQSVQPVGPYFIGGYSLGANIAFEISQQLHDKNQEVGALFLIDGWAAFSNELKDYDRFQAAMQRALEQISDNIPSIIADKSRLLGLAWRRMQLLFNYAPRKVYDNAVILFKAIDILEEYKEINEATNHWQDYVSKKIIVHHIPANHETILKAENAKQIGIVIRNKIAELKLQNLAKV